MTAVQLAERTKELGYPVSRVAVTKIENNTRAGKLDVAELLVLAHALDLPPGLLLFPGYPQGVLNVLPGRSVDNEAAMGWLSGRSSWQVAKDNEGTQLVEDVARRRDLRRQIVHAELVQSMVPDEAGVGVSNEVRNAMIAELTAQLAATDERITEAQRRIWGEDQGK
jgi:hypothetical protein